MNILTAWSKVIWRNYPKFPFSHFQKFCDNYRFLLLLKQILCTNMIFMHTRRIILSAEACGFSLQVGMDLLVYHLQNSFCQILKKKLTPLVLVRMPLHRRFHSVCYREIEPSRHMTQNDVVSTLMRHNDVVSTSVRRHYDVMCPLGITFTQLSIDTLTIILISLLWHTVQSTSV